MSDKNSSFFFRDETIGDTEGNSFVDVPEDLEWAVVPGKTEAISRRGGFGTGSVGSPGADVGDNGSVDQGYTNPNHYPDTRIDTPVIQGIIKQEVSQDPEGKATIDVTFAVTDLRQTSVEWELRITR